jgi:hypothetical protein
MSIKHIIAGGIAALAVAAGIGVGAVAAKAHGDQHSTHVAARVECAEDMPCWDWRTMGNHQRGVCITDTPTGDHDMLEAPDGSLTPGGRGCEQAYEQSGVTAQCENVTYALKERNLALPVGWSIDCHEWAQERGVTTLRYGGAPVGGLAVYAEKKIYLDAGSWSTDQDLQGAAAHEVCHAIRFAQGRTSPDYLIEERAADTCARNAGFIVPNHGV